MRSRWKLVGPGRPCPVYEEPYEGSSTKGELATGRMGKPGCSGQFEGAVKDDLLPELGGQEVESPLKRREDESVEALADGSEPEIVSDKSDTAAEDDPLWGQERNGMG